jgi:hypothetical protein
VLGCGILVAAGFDEDAHPTVAVAQMLLAKFRPGHATLDDCSARAMAATRDEPTPTQARRQVPVPAGLRRARLVGSRPRSGLRLMASRLFLGGHHSGHFAGHLHIDFVCMSVL